MNKNMERADIVIVGGGIAGVSLAYFLTTQGITGVIVLEAERLFNVHSSGRSNSNFIHLFEPDFLASLSVKSESFFRDPPEALGSLPLISDHGAFTVVTEKDLPRHRAEIRKARELGIVVEEVEESKVLKRIPVLKPGRIAAAAYYPRSGPIDSASLSSLYVRHSRKAGVRFQLGRSLIGVRTMNGRIVEALTDTGPIACDMVVNAAGAWAGHIGALCGASAIPFSAKRRHLISASLPRAYEPHGWPSLRNNSVPFYMKAESRHVLFSPMDEEDQAPGDCTTDDMQVALAADRINQETTLEIRHIERKWAGFRTFAPDRIPVIGFDKKLHGFFWLAGQGGVGIQTSPALGLFAAQTIAGVAQADSISAAVSPVRFEVHGGRQFLKPKKGGEP